MKHVKIVTVLIGCLLAVTLTACAPHHTGSKASALASSTAGQTAKKDAKTMLAGCMPSQAGQTSVLAWESALKKCDIPKGKRLTTAKCITRKLTAGTLPPKGDARNTYIVNNAFPCIQENQS